MERINDEAWGGKGGGADVYQACVAIWALSVVKHAAVLRETMHGGALERSVTNHRTRLGVGRDVRAHDVEPVVHQVPGEVWGESARKTAPVRREPNAPATFRPIWTAGCASGRTGEQPASVRARDADYSLLRPRPTDEIRDTSHLDLAFLREIPNQPHTLGRPHDRHRGRHLPRPWSRLQPHERSGSPPSPRSRRAPLPLHARCDAPYCISAAAHSRRYKSNAESRAL